MEQLLCVSPLLSSLMCVWSNRSKVLERNIQCSSLNLCFLVWSTGLSCPDFQASGAGSSGCSRTSFPMRSGYVGRGCRTLTITPHAAEVSWPCWLTRSRHISYTFHFWFIKSHWNVSICLRLLKTWGLNTSFHPSDLASESNLYVGAVLQ